MSTEIDDDAAFAIDARTKPKASDVRVHSKLNRHGNTTPATANTPYNHATADFIARR